MYAPLCFIEIMIGNINLDTIFVRSNSAKDKAGRRPATNNIENDKYLNFKSAEFSILNLLDVEYLDVPRDSKNILYNYIDI